MKKVVDFVSKSVYRQLLKDKRWRRKRARVILRDECKCQLCGHNNIRNLVVHHKRYLSGHLPWEYDNNDLITLCRYCHGKVHAPDINDLNLHKTWILMIFKYGFTKRRKAA